MPKIKLGSDVPGIRALLLLHGPLGTSRSLRMACSPHSEEVKLRSLSADHSPALVPCPFLPSLFTGSPVICGVEGRLRIFEIMFCCEMWEEHLLIPVTGDSMELSSDSSLDGWTDATCTWKSPTLFWTYGCLIISCWSFINCLLLSFPSSESFDM